MPNCCKAAWDWCCSNPHSGCLRTHGRVLPAKKLLRVEGVVLSCSVSNFAICIFSCSNNVITKKLLVKPPNRYQSIFSHALVFSASKAEQPRQAAFESRRFAPCSRAPRCSLVLYSALSIAIVRRVRRRMRKSLLCCGERWAHFANQSM